jgi:hypothetical protein
MFSRKLVTTLKTQTVGLAKILKLTLPVEIIIPLFL